MSAPRSYLFVPGTSADRFPKALASGADAVIVDLEDAVAVTAKDFARERTRRWLADVDPGPVELWVRVNAGVLGDADVAALAELPALTGVCVPKVESADALRALDALLERQSSRVLVEPFLESAAGIEQAAAIAAAPRVRRLHIGEVDLAADLGVDPGPDESELLWARSAIVAASARAGVPSPVGPVSLEFRHADAFRASSDRVRRLGFWGRDCIHPLQIPVANAAFTPSPGRVRWAEDVMNRLGRAAAVGGGATVGEDGRLIDEAVARVARRLLDRQ